MVEMQRKRPFLSPRARVAVGIGIIALLVVFSFFAPPEGESNNITGDPATVPTVSITNLVSSQPVNRIVTIDRVQISILSVLQARKFSDDRKRIGAYTIRVKVQTKNTQPVPVGIDYASRVRLVLPTGEVLVPKYISVKPVDLPMQGQGGYFDFPVSTSVSLSALQLLIDGKHAVPLTSAVS